jgi:hypothetical protein
MPLAHLRGDSLASETGAEGRPESVEVHHVARLVFMRDLGPLEVLAPCDVRDGVWEDMCRREGQGRARCAARRFWRRASDNSGRPGRVPSARSALRVIQARVDAFAAPRMSPIAVRSVRPWIRIDLERGFRRDGASG